MIMYAIFFTVLGALFGYIAAVLMVVSSNTDRQREEQEESPLVMTTVNETKLAPIVAHVRIPRDELEQIDETKQREYINYKLMGAIEKQLLDYVIVERDPRYMEYVCALRLWAKKE